MPIANIVSFDGGLVNKPTPHLLADNQAVVVENCSIDTGAIVPLKDTLLAATVGTTNASIYQFNGAWETHTGERWYVEDGGRLFWADGGIPQKKHPTLGTVRLGIAAPASAPTSGTLNTSGAGGIVLPSSGAQYVVTFFSDPLLTGGWGGESAPSPALSVIQPADRYFVLMNDPDGNPPLKPDGTHPSTLYAATTGATFPASGTLSVDGELMNYSSCVMGLTQVVFTISQRGVNGTTISQHNQGTAGHIAYSSVDLTGIPTSTDPQVNARRIWRLLAGEYRLVGQINDNTATTFTDTVSDATLSGASILTGDDNDAPPNLDWLCGPYNGMLVGGYTDTNGRHTVRWSKVGEYDAWPSDYALDDFRGAVLIGQVFGDGVALFTQDGIHILSGSDPAAMSRTKALTHLGCVSGRSVADAGRGLLYLSPDGVCLFDGAFSQVVSSASLLRETTALTNPKAAFFSGHYYLFHDGGCLIGDFRSESPLWRTATVTASSVFRSDVDDALYLGKPNEIHAWGAGGDLPWRYWTGELALGALSATKVFHTLTCHYEADVRCELYVDGKRLHDKSIQGARRAYRMRLSGAARGYRPQLRMSGTGTVYGLEFEYSGPGRAR